VKISDVDGKMRVCLRPDIYEGYAPYPWMRREFGTLTSGRILPSGSPYEEGLFVRVKWDGFPTPESWHLEDLVPALSQQARSRKAN